MPRCIACTTNSAAVIDIHGAYTILHCVICGLQFSDPMSSDTSGYAAAYDLGEAPKEIVGAGLPFLGWTEQASPELREFRFFMTAAQQFALKIIRRRFKTGQPALDVGFGAGWFLGAMRHAGLSPFGLEVAERPLRVLAQKGFPVGNYSIDQLPSEWPSPALVTAFEVVEHLEDPLGFLTMLQRKYFDADVLLSVPDESCWFFLAGRPPHDYPPNHMTRWSPLSMNIALKKAGFKFTKVWRVRPTPQELCMASVRRFFPWKSATKQSRGGEAEVRPSTSLIEELRRRSLKRKLAVPLAGLLPLIGKTACSMLAMGSNRPIN